jgi:hypothetical protein
MPRIQSLSQQDRRARDAERNRTSWQAADASADPGVLARQRDSRERRIDRDRHWRASIAASTDPDVVAQRVRMRVSQTERQRMHRQAMAASTDPDVVTERERTRERDRICQRSRCTVARRPAASHCSIPATNFLPPHQRTALNGFMDRLFSVRSSLAQCETCLERYHGIHMCGLQCDSVTVRCFQFELLCLFLLTGFSPAFIVTVRRTKLTPASFQTIWRGYCSGSRRWKKCCAASRHLVFSCGSVKAGSTRVEETL